MEFWAAIKNNRVISLLWTTAQDFSSDNGNLMASAVAYSLLFSLFPFALAAISVSGFLMSSAEVENQIITAMGNLIPVARNLITGTLETVIKTREVTGVIAVLALIWSALSFFDALRNSLNSAWGLPNSQTYIKGRLINITMLVLAVVAMIAFTWLTTSLHYMHEADMRYGIIKLTRNNMFTRVIFMLLSAVMAYGVTLFLYRFIPSHRPKWKHIWLGALLATIGFEAVRYAFVWYVKNFGQYNLVYGPIGSVIALLMFIYLTAWVLLFFAKFSYVKMRRDREGLLIAGNPPPVVE
ncbi:MAG: YihY/virulence factor BrkB family protein [Chloroflexi bacterium]|nr:YihY/virulence factor BrkB family protein [Chloroflexota bacterium]